MNINCEGLCSDIKVDNISKLDDLMKKDNCMKIVLYITLFFNLLIIS